MPGMTPLLAILEYCVINASMRPRLNAGDDRSSP